MKYVKKTYTKINESGQALLLVLLAMAAILTVVLSVASRSVTDVSVTSSEENALRAFSAAEAGIEKALLTGQSSGGSEVSADPNDSTVTYASEILTAPEGVDFIYPSLLYTGESATFWFVGKDSNGNLTCANGCMSGVSQLKDLCWGYYPVNSTTYPTADVKPAVSMTVYYDPTLKSVAYGDFSGVKVSRVAYDGYTAGTYSTRTPANNFYGYDNTGGTCTIRGTKFGFKEKSITFNSLGIPAPCWNTPGCLLMAKVRVYYNDPAKPEQVAIDIPGGFVNGLPAQGNVIVSTGAAGESERKVNVFQSFAESPSLFDAAIFSKSDFSK